MTEGPTRDLASEERELKALAAQYGQDHIFRFYRGLNSGERALLLSQVRRIDFALIQRLVKEQLVSGTPSEGGELSPAPVIRIPETREEIEKEASARRKGEELLRQGKVAAFVVAGGQGTRLGFDGPKGTFEIGPITHRTLFQHHAEKILALSRRHGAPIPWYIMTSEANHAPTVDFFRRHKFFGFAEKDIGFFQQEMIPAVDRQGKFLLEAKCRVFTNPNGHGGSLKALHESGALREMRRRGVEFIFYFQVDNPLIAICDPVFVGYHALAGASMSSKVVRKSGWKEKVGVIGLRDGKLTVIEYSDLPEAKAKETLPDGSLKYWAGSIAIHVLSAEFVETLNRGGFRLQYHRAEKSVPYIDEKGELQKPKEKNGIKFETFVFDALGAARTSVTMETRREEDFSPVKNATGEDSPEQARKDMTAQALRWLEACGARIQRDGDGRFAGFVEVSPLAALDAADIAKRVRPGTAIQPGFVM